MNGVWNIIFLVFLMMMLVATDYIYSIGDIIVDQTYGAIDSNEFTDIAYGSYATTREFVYGLITGVLAPFLIFLSFFSSFVNRNQNFVTYTIQVIGLLFLTPILIYMFSEMATQMLNVSILNHAYMATTILDNFLYILVANAILAVASFVFVKQGVSEYA